MLLSEVRKMAAVSRTLVVFAGKQWADFHLCADLDDGEPTNERVYLANEWAAADDDEGECVDLWPWLSKEGREAIMDAYYAQRHQEAVEAKETGFDDGELELRR